VSSKLYIEFLQHLSRRCLSLLPARFPKFAAVGLSGVAVDMAILWLLRGHLGWPLTLSKVIAAELAMASNFVWNDLWTFADIAQHQGHGFARLRRFAKFNGICAAGLALSVGVLHLQVGVFGMNPYAANAVAIAVTTGWNFWMNKIFCWSAPRLLDADSPCQRRSAGG
jgi:dolichol-phosphate mannosyltransferase